ncbi:hypothetical protein B0H11DRAFT_2234100 [Mycena galericulata]|nr:hypothetical protein B0H11DRAFT_2234100 [Mycena galericulata]
MSAPSSSESPAPRFKITVQPPGTFPAPALREIPVPPADYPAVRAAASIVLAHLASSPVAQGTLLFIVMHLFLYDEPCQAAFLERWPGRDLPNAAMIEGYAREAPPDVVLAAPGDLEMGAGVKMGSERVLAWGAVLGSEPRNEVFVPVDLAEGLEILTDDGSQPASTLQVKQRTLIWMIAYAHELAYCVIKHIFGPIVVPRFEGWFGARGDAGEFFVFRVLEFTMQVEFVSRSADGEARAPDRMERILRVLGKYKRKIYEIDEGMLDAFLASFHTQRMHKPDFSGVRPYVCADPFTRWRCLVGGIASEEGDDGSGTGSDGEDEGDPPPRDSMLGIGSVGDGVACRLTSSCRD